MLSPTLLFLTAVFSVVLVTASQFDASDSVYEADDLVERLQDAAAAKGENEAAQCSSIGGKCFNTGHCCDGLICAVLDDEDGAKPEAPGYCVKSKDLKLCNEGTDVPEGCPTGQRCVALARMEQRYCLPIGGRENGGPLDFRSIKATDRRRYHNQAGNKGAGKLGSSCVTDDDCIPKSENGQHKMCCQLVNRGRQGAKRICDRVTQISTCISR